MCSVRAVLFVDGSNWHHGLKSIGVDSGSLDYRRVARDLLIDRELIGIRFYVGKVRGDLKRVRPQGRFLSRLRDQGVRVFLGRIERRSAPAASNPVAAKLRDRITSHADDLPETLRRDLLALCNEDVPYYVEKQVDVRIAVDIVSGALTDEYDVAYLLSADGDFVPAVEQARKAGKKVFMASPVPGHQLGQAATATIRLDREWLRGLGLVQS